MMLVRLDVRSNVSTLTWVLECVMCTAEIVLRTRQQRALLN
jgi:hypothetical protein